LPDINLMLLAYLAFFLPIAAYCLVLAMINRRVNPLMVSGVWDAIGLLLACSGGLLVCGPGIIYVNFSRYSMLQTTELDDDGNQQHKHQQDENEAEEPAASWNIWWIAVSTGYFVLVIGGAILMVRGRRDKTIIYNVDLDLFDMVLGRVLEKCQLAFVRLSRKVHIGPRQLAPVQDAENPTATATTAANKEATGIRAVPVTGEVLKQEGRLGEVNIEPFPAMCHLTLHWQHTPPALREEIEDELRRNLDECRALENPSASWFLGISSVLFFFIIAVIVFFLLSIFMPR
jgi:hypothetical protein